jgi:cyclic pyranopterin phosphate synthase
MPPGGVAKVGRDRILSYEQIVRFVNVVMRHFGLSKAHITGGEPLVRPGIVRLVEMLSAEGVPDLALTTNGQELAAMAGPLQSAGLHRVNVSLDTLDGEVFAALTGGGRIGPVIEGIRAARRAGFAVVKLNTLVLRGYNDAEVVRLAEWALDEGCDIRFLELMPIGPAAQLHDGLFVPTDEVKRRLGSAFQLEPLAAEGGGTAQRYMAADAQGRRGVVGFISSESHPFCAGCSRLRLTAAGRLVGCLGLGAGPEIGPLIAPGARQEAELIELVGQTLRMKRSGAFFTTDSLMSQIGG